MKIISIDGRNDIVELDESDVDSAVRAFVCACYPQYRVGHLINPDAQAATARVFRSEEHVGELNSEPVGTN